MSRCKVKKKDTYKEQFNYNKTGKNRYGESRIIEEKAQKTVRLSLSTIDDLMDIAKLEGMTQSDVIEFALKKYIKEYRAKG